MQLINRTTLVALSKHKNMSVRDLARESKVNRSTVGHLLSGKRDTCAPENAKAIARALGVPTEALFHVRLATVAPDMRRGRVA